MKLHARSVAAAAGASGAQFDEVVRRLVDSGEVKAWKAREILDEIKRTGRRRPDGRAAGKIILLGEHGVVYGRHALALPIPDAVHITLEEADDLEHELPDQYVTRLLDELGVEQRNWRIHVDSRLPLGKGLGSSAAIAVATARAFDRKLGLGLDDARINDVAFEVEKLAHGTPSGIDNTLATYAAPMLFSNADGLQFDVLEPSGPAPVLVAWGEETGKTSELVAGVRAGHERAGFDAIFDEMDRLSQDGARLLAAGDWDQLGALMNICHGLLNAIGVSTPVLERMVTLARDSGAVGAKLTGAGGGGSIVALCPGNIDEVRNALRRAGYNTL